MRTSSTSGFDLREAVDSLRDAIETRVSGRFSPEGVKRDIRSAILTELAVEPMHGYQLIKAIETRSGGAFTPTAGAVYPTLQLLADEELVTAAQVGERKVYSLTDAGRAAATEATVPSEPRSHQPGGTLTKSSVKLAQAVAQFSHSASAEQTGRAAAIIDDARRKLYAILAED